MWSDEVAAGEGVTGFVTHKLCHKMNTALLSAQSGGHGNRADSETSGPCCPPSHSGSCCLPPGGGGEAAPLASQERRL